MCRCMAKSLHVWAVTAMYGYLQETLLWHALILHASSTTCLKTLCITWINREFDLHLSMLDLVSAILLRLETLNPKALPLWPLFMKLPKASTTSSIWVSRLLRTTSLEAFRMAVGKEHQGKMFREEQLERSYSWWLIQCVCTLSSASTLLYYIMHWLLSIQFRCFSTQPP